MSKKNQRPKDFPSWENDKEKWVEEWGTRSILCDPVAATKAQGYLSVFVADSKGNEDNRTILYEKISHVVLNNFHVANWKIRANAVTTLSILYPMFDSTLSASEREEEMINQGNLICERCEDPHEIVRVSAIKAAGRILLDFWMILPHDLRIKLLKNCEQSSFDRSSHLVRASVIDVYQNLVQDPILVSVIAKILPRLSHCVSDENSNVVRKFNNLVHQILMKGETVSLDEIWPLRIVAERLGFWGLTGEMGEIGGDAINRISSQHVDALSLPLYYILTGLFGDGNSAGEFFDEKIKIIKNLCDQIPVPILRISSKIWSFIFDENDFDQEKFDERRITSLETAYTCLQERRPISLSLPVSQALKLAKLGVALIKAVLRSLKHRVAAEDSNGDMKERQEREAIEEKQKGGKKGTKGGRKGEEREERENREEREESDIRMIQQDGIVAVGEEWSPLYVQMTVASKLIYFLGILIYNEALSSSGPQEPADENKKTAGKSKKKKTGENKNTPEYLLSGEEKEEIIRLTRVVRKDLFHYDNFSLILETPLRDCYLSSLYSLLLRTSSLQAELSPLLQNHANEILTQMVRSIRVGPNAEANVRASFLRLLAHPLTVSWNVTHQVLKPFWDTCRFAVLSLAKNHHIKIAHTETTEEREEREREEREREEREERKREEKEKEEAGKRRRGRAKAAPKAAKGRKGKKNQEEEEEEEEREEEEREEREEGETREGRKRKMDDSEEESDLDENDESIAIFDEIKESKIEKICCILRTLELIVAVSGSREQALLIQSPKKLYRYARATARISWFIVSLLETGRGGEEGGLSQENVMRLRKQLDVSLLILRTYLRYCLHFELRTFENKRPSNFDTVKNMLQCFFDFMTTFKNETGNKDETAILANALETDPSEETRVIKKKKMDNQENSHQKIIYKTIKKFLSPYKKLVNVFYSAEETAVTTETI